MATVIGIVGKLELNIYLLTKLGLNGYLLTHDGPDHYPTIIAPTELSYPETFTGAEEFVEMDEYYSLTMRGLRSTVRLWLQQ